MRTAGVRNAGAWRRRHPPPGCSMALAPVAFRLHSIRTGPPGSPVQDRRGPATVRGPAPAWAGVARSTMPLGTSREGERGCLEPGDRPRSTPLTSFAGEDGAARRFRGTDSPLACGKERHHAVCTLPVRGSRAPRTSKAAVPGSPSTRPRRRGGGRGRVGALRVLTWAACALPVLAACSADPAPREEAAAGEESVRDAAGRLHATSTQPQRVISLVPSATELILALGAGDRLVARTRYDEQRELAPLPSLGGGLDPNLEAVTALRPDLVVVTPDGDLRPTVGRLEALGVPVFSASSGTVDAFRELALTMGAVLGGEATARASALVDSLDAGLEQLRRRTADGPRPSVLYLVWHDPPMTTGPGGYLDDLIRAAGGRSTFDDQPVAWPTVSVEEIVRRNPDWVILAERDPDSGERLRWIREAPGWRELAAVREGRVAVVESALFNRPGPRMLEAARTLAAILRP